MAEFPALPLFTDAVVADCNHLSDDEFGLYMRILILMWRSPECQIPAQAEWLEKRLKRDITVIVPLLTEFCISDGNFFTQKRLYKEYLWVKKRSKKQSVNAKSLWNKKKVLSQTDAKSMPNDSQTDAPHPTPPHPTQEETTRVVSPPSPVCDMQAAFELYNVTAEKAGLPKCQVLSQKRKSHLKLRLKECGGIDGWKVALEKVAGSSFLTGGGPKGWRASFDFLMQESSFIKLMEGTYDDRKSTSKPKTSAHDALAAGFAQALADHEVR